MAVNPTPRTSPSGTLGETEHFLKYPTIAPSSDKETRDNWQFTENWANRLPKISYAIAYFTAEVGIPGDGTKTQIANVRVETGTSYIFFVDLPADPTLSLSFYSDPLPYGVAVPDTKVLKWVGKSGYIDVKFYVEVTTSGAVDWPSPSNISLSPVHIQGEGATMTQLISLL